MRACLVALLLGATLILSACAAAAGAATAPGTTLTMSASTFVGRTSFTIHAGQALTLVDPASTGGIHNLVTGSNGLFMAESGAPAAIAAPAGIDFQPGRSQAITFTQPGTYSITCTIHPAMQATITVS
jgi:plastocyanin